MIVGVIGKSGSGKTTWAKWFEEKGFFRISLDELSRSIDPIVAPQVDARWPGYRVDGVFNRKAFGDWIFNPEHSKDLEEFNAIYRVEIQEALASVMSKEHPWSNGSQFENFVVEGHTLPEGLAVDALFWIVSDTQEQIRRLKLREPDADPETLANRLKIQKEPETFDNILVTNMDSLEDFKERFEYEYYCMQTFPNDPDYSRNSRKIVPQN